MNIKGDKSNTDKPCVDLCSLLHGGEFCTGCGLMLEEDIHWMEMSDKDKREANINAAQRLKEYENG